MDAPAIKTALIPDGSDYPWQAYLDWPGHLPCTYGSSGYRGRTEADAIRRLLHVYPEVAR